MRSAVLLAVSVGLAASSFCRRSGSRKVGGGSVGAISRFSIPEAAGLALRPELTRAAATMVGLMARWDERRFKAGFAANLTPSAFRGFFAEASALWGKCKVGAGRVTGPRGAVFTLECERAAPELRIKLAADGPAITDWTMRVPSDGPCR